MKTSLVTTDQPTRILDGDSKCAKDRSEQGICAEEEGGKRPERNKTYNSTLFEKKRLGAASWSCTYLRFNWSCLMVKHFRGLDKSPLNVRTF